MTNTREARIAFKTRPDKEWDKEDYNHAEYLKTTKPKYNITNPFFIVNGRRIRKNASE